MKMTQKTVTPHRQQEDLPAEIPAAKGSEVSEKAAELLEDIDCCLAENEEEEIAKAKARAEWDALAKDDSGYFPVNAIMYHTWIAKYSHLFEFCCGVPQFDD